MIFSVLQVSSEQCASKDILLVKEQSLLAMTSLRTSCRNMRRFQISVTSGQRMNVSVWNFAAQQEMNYGRMRDLLSSNILDIKVSQRYQQILTSVGNHIQVELSGGGGRDQQDFLIDITVIGCGDMTPPEGAWMTRDGDVIEIGCHSGSKSWTLTCEGNNWIGVLGYCGWTQ